MVIGNTYGKRPPLSPRRRRPGYAPLPPPHVGGGRGVEAFRQLWGKEGGLSRLTSHVSRFTWFLFFLLLPTHAFSDDQAVADLIAARDFRSALTRLDSLLSLKDLPVPARGRAILQRALCHKALAQPADALAGFEASHDAFPELKDYLLLWEGECLEALDQPDRASARYAALVKQAPKSPFRDDARLRIARLTDRAGRHEEAARLYRQVAGAAPGADDVAEALSGLASAQASLKQTVEARETCRTLIRNHPGSRWALKALQPFGAPRTAADRYDRGQVYFHHGQWADAIASFRSLIARHPSDTRVGMARYFEARAHFAAKDYASAASGFTTAYRRHRVRAALFYLGRCAVRADDDRRGADLLLEFATKYPAHESADDALWYAAWSLERLGDHAKARQTYLRLAARHPASRNVEQSKFRACLALSAAGRLAEAARAFAALGEASQGYLRDQAYFWAGKCHEKLGNLAAAKRCYSQAARSYPASYYAARAALALSPEEREALLRQVLQSANGARSADSALSPFASPSIRGLQPLLGDTAIRSSRVAPQGRIEGSPFLRRGDLLILLGLYNEAGRELYPVERASDNDLSALRSLLRRYERIRSFGRAMRVAGRIVELEQRAEGRLSLDTFRRLYPTYYADLIERPAVENRVEPPLVLAIIRQESAFDPAAVSSAGARGLMQVLPTTGAAWAANLGIQDFKPQDLDDPAISIRYGCREIASYLTRFPRDLRGTVLALSSYNASLAVAQEWDKALPADVDELVENIPYHETRGYVKQVLRNYEIYKLLLAAR